MEQPNSRLLLATPEVAKDFWASNGRISLAMARLRFLRNALRLAMTLGLGGVLVWAIGEARSEWAVSGSVEGMKCWLMGLTAGFALSLWAPWRWIRIAGAAILLVVFGGASLILALLILAGGPDAKQGAPEGVVLGVVAGIVALCLPMVGFIVCEAQLGRGEKS